MRAGRYGSYVSRHAEGGDDLSRAQDLRWRAFRGGAGGGSGSDADSYDALSRHVLIEDASDGRLVATFRFMPLTRAEDVERCYSAQFYDLSALTRYPAPMVEMGRFCVAPGCHDPDIVRVAWGAMARFVTDEGIGMLFGCTSFRGTEVEGYLDVFGLLKERYLGPEQWLPGVKATDVFPFAGGWERPPDTSLALRTMPPLLRAYLALGGWVGDHAVIDRELGTVHVFTGLEVALVSEPRARSLRALATTQSAPVRLPGTDHRVGAETDDQVCL